MSFPSVLLHLIMNSCIIRTPGLDKPTFHLLAESVAAVVHSNGEGREFCLRAQPRVVGSHVFTAVHNLTWAVAPNHRSNTHQQQHNKVHFNEMIRFHSTHKYSRWEAETMSNTMLLFSWEELRWSLCGNNDREEGGGMYGALGVGHRSTDVHLLLR